MKKVFTVVVGIGLAVIAATGIILVVRKFKSALDKAEDESCDDDYDYFEDDFEDDFEDEEDELTYTDIFPSSKESDVATSVK